MWAHSWFESRSVLLVVVYCSSDSGINCGHPFCFSLLPLYFLMFASLSVLRKYSVAFRCFISGKFEGRSSIKDALASTVSPKRRSGVSKSLSRRWRWLPFLGRRFPFYLVMAFWSFFVGSVGFIPTIHCFEVLAARIAFGLISCAVTSLSVMFTCLLPFISFHFSALRFEMTKFIAMDAVFFFGAWLGLLCALLFGLARWSLILVLGGWASLYGVSSVYALFSIFLTWSGILAYITLPINCWASDPNVFFCCFLEDVQNVIWFLCCGITFKRVSLAIVLSLWRENFRIVV